MAQRLAIAFLPSALGASWTAPAFAAEPPVWHLEAGGAHALGDPQGREFGAGAEGRLAAELPLARPFGLELEAGSLWLSHASRPADPSLADHGDGAALFAMVGARLHPTATISGGPWLDANLGYVRTGALDRFGFDAHVGYDWRLGEGAWDIGPYLGYLQIVQGASLLRPEDAHVLSLGVHVALDSARRPPPAPVAALPPDPPPAETPPPEAVAPDRDGDGIADAADACPDLPGIPSQDPDANGCPAAEDVVHAIDDRIEYGEIVLFDTERAEVKTGAWAVLRTLAEFINRNPRIEELSILGHADERGPADYNLRLSQARAQAVKRKLVGFGVDTARLTATGLGARQPRALGHGEGAWRQNRYVQFRIARVAGANGESRVLSPARDGGAP